MDCYLLVLIRPQMLSCVNQLPLIDYVTEAQMSRQVSSLEVQCSGKESQFFCLVLDFSVEASEHAFASLLFLEGYFESLTLLFDQG